jgi:hypothetical protein
MKRDKIQFKVGESVILRQDDTEISGTVIKILPMMKWGEKTKYEVAVGSMIYTVCNDEIKRNGWLF